MALKRFIDVLVALLGLVLLSPLLLALSMFIFLAMGSPVCFRQARPGLNGRIFTLVKFRTMTTVTDSEGSPLPDSARLTPMGSFLRKTSLDELPQLWNVLKGELSLVGPRPLLVHYLDLYTPEQMRRHHAKPGITGWAQVNGRNDITWEEKFALDVWYVDNWSLLLDFKILAMTVVKVIEGEGVSQTGHVTAEQFTGTADTLRPSDTRTIRSDGQLPREQ